MKDVIGVGALNVDLVYEVKRPRLNGVLAKRVEPGGEITCSEEDYKALSDFIRKTGRFVWQSGGGQAANTCYALARWGFSTGFVGKVGRDEFGEFLKNSLEGVDTRAIVTDEFSGVCLIVVQEEGERTIFVFPNANQKLTLEEIDISYVFNSRFLYFSSFAGEKPFQAQISLACLLPEKVKLALDIGEIYAQKGFEKLKPLLRKAEIVFGTEKELALLTDGKLIDSTERLLAEGVKILVLKRGAKGAKIITRGEDFFVPAPKVEAVDTTGAGDVFAAGFLAGLLNGLDLEKSGKLASLLAARSVTGYGRSAYPDLVFFEQALKEVES